MAEQFPLPGSSYKELIKIIQGYGQVSGEAVPSDVAKLISIHETIVSANNKFLVAVGIVQGGKRKTMTSTGRGLALALLHGMEEEISGHWRTIAEATEFLQNVVAAVRIRKGMDEPDLEAHVAYSAGQPKTPRVLAGAGTVVEILKVSGLLKEDGGNLVASAPPVARPTTTVEEKLTPTAAPTYPVPAPIISTEIETHVPGGVRLNIDVRIQCTPQDLDGLGQKLRKMLDDFNKQQGEKSTETQ